MEKVHLLKYPWVNGVVLMEVGGSVMVKFVRGDCTVLLREALGKGWLLEGLDVEREKGWVELREKLRKGITKAVKDEVVDAEIGDV